MADVSKILKTAGTISDKVAGRISDIHGAIQCIVQITAWVGGFMAAWLHNLPFWAVLLVALLPGLLLGCGIATWNQWLLGRVANKPKGTNRQGNKAKTGKAKTNKPKTAMQEDNWLIPRLLLRVVIVGVLLATFTMPFWKRETTAEAHPTKLENLEAKLQVEYPLGYVIFDVEGNRMGPMQFHPDETILQADWREARVEVDRKSKVAKITVPNVNWKLVSGGGIFGKNGGRVVFESQYKLHQPAEIGKNFSFPGKPLIFFEMLDDTGSVPKCVVGFK